MRKLNIFLLFYYVISCPDTCDCGNSIGSDGKKNRGLYSCSDSEIIEEVPYGLEYYNKSITELRIQNTNIAKIGQLEFRNFRNLKSLHVDNNQIIEVEPSAFINFQNMELMDLSSNKITHFPEQLFVPMTKLAALYFDHNLIEFLIQDFTFMPQLKILSLTNNKIKSIKWWHFQPLNLDRLFVKQGSWIQY